MQKTVSIVSLGCPRNLVDSEQIVTEFKQKGYVYQEEAEGSDVLIINTCAFIKEAKEESIDTILKAIDLKREGSVKKIIIAGCLSERYKAELPKELKEVDEFMGVADFKKLDPGRFSVSLTPDFYSYVKISEGCRNRCSYCIIPYLKSNYTSRPVESIINEAKELISKGVREIILIGQDTSLYGIDLYKKKLLPELLEKIAELSGNNWVRLLYLHPANLDKKAIDVIKANKNICRYVDLPIEHISDTVLKRMARHITKKEIIALIEYVRKNIPEAAIRTSIITGFPGETEKEFKELVKFIKEIKFERLGLFRYSREEGTPAFNHKKQVPKKEIEARFNEIMSLQQDISGKLNEKFKGRPMRVLIEEKQDNCYLGRTEYDAPEVDGLVYVKAEGLKIGEFYDVNIVDTYEYDLTGELK